MAKAIEIDFESKDLWAESVLAIGQPFSVRQLFLSFFIFSVFLLFLFYDLIYVEQMVRGAGSMQTFPKKGGKNIGGALKSERHDFKGGERYFFKFSVELFFPI